MDSITRTAIKEEALKRGWKFEQFFQDEAFYKITNDKSEWRLGRGSRLGFHDANGAIIVRDKQRSYEFVESLGIRVAPYAELDSYEEALTFLSTYKTVVMKPRDAEQSNGVTVGITDPGELKQAYEEAKKYSARGVIGQVQLMGNLYRVLVVGDKVIAAAERRAAFVTGDGVHSVEQLIDLKNEDPRRSKDIASILKPIDPEIVRHYLGKETFESVLTVGEKLSVDPIASVSRGGESSNVTKTVSSDLEAMLVKITRLLGLGICGFDLMTEDIATLSPTDTLPLVELNSMPGFKIHLFPTGEGPAIDPSPFVLDEAFSRSYTSF